LKIGLKQISERAGCSVTTVSNVLNNRPGTSKKTAEMILTIAQELGYFDQGNVRAIKFVIYKKHGSVVAETPFFGELIEGVEGECRRNGLPLQIIHLNRNDRDFATTIGLLLQDFSSAILLLATELEEKDIEPFNNTAVPVALLDGWSTDARFSATCISNEDGAIRAVKYLSEYGHKNIGYLKSLVPINNFMARDQGYRIGLGLCSIPFEEKYQIVLTPSMEGAYRDMKKYLCDVPEIPSAYFADNDFIALGAIKALVEYGIDVPRDVSVVGFDDISYSGILTPALTTVKVHKRALGATGVRTLLNSVQDNSEGEVRIKVYVYTDFTERDSVARIG